MKSLLVLATTITFLLRSAYADGVFDEYARKHFENLRANGTAVFYSECVQGSGKAVLLFGLAEKTALLIEWQGGAVVNLATISIGHNDFKIKDTHGGTYSYGRVRGIVKDLLGYPFKFVTPEKIKDIAASKPTRSCPEAPPA